MATFYIDPSSPTNGDGSEANPFNTWSAVTWAVSNTYLQKCGTTFFGGVDVNVANPANEAQRVRLGCYGVGSKPVIDAQKAVAYCIRVQNKNFITIEDFVTRNASNTNIQILGNQTRACSHIHVRRCEAYNATFDGISNIQAVTSTSMAPSPAVGNLFEDCYAENCGQHGVGVVAFADGAILRRCRARSCSHTSSGWGVYLGGFASTFFGGWTLVGGTVYERTLTTNLTVTSVLSGQSTAAYQLVNGTFASLNDGEWAQSGTTLRVNLNRNVNSGTSISVVYQECTNGTIEYCEAWDMSPNFDGVGIGLDRGARGCRVLSSYGHDNPGAGVETAQAISSVVTGNYCERNGKFGVHIATSPGTNVVRNNTCLDNGDGGISVERNNAGTTTTVENNLVRGGTTGLFAQLLGGTFVADFNLVSGATTSYSGWTPGANDLAFDPSPYIASGGTLKDSTASFNNPLATAGKYANGVRLRNGRMRPGRCPIGAYQGLLTRVPRA